MSNNPYYYPLRAIIKAQKQFNIIQPGDRILVGLSGGKDSIALWYLLKQLQFISNGNFEIIPGHVMFKWSDGSTVDAIRRNGIEPILIEAQQEDGPQSCFRCAWLRKKAIFEGARTQGCKKIALAHHLDDLAETALINLFYHKQLFTMYPLQDFFYGELYIIRPLCYLPVGDIIRLNRKMSWQPVEECCPLAPHNIREDLKEPLRLLNRTFPKGSLRLVEAALASGPLPRSKRGNPNFYDTFKKPTS
jgi:tRNA 2-thiocytidine biosynthesis protein TtcA